MEELFEKQNIFDNDTLQEDTDPSSILNINCNNSYNLGKEKTQFTPTIRILIWQIVKDTKGDKKRKPSELSAKESLIVNRAFRLHPKEMALEIINQGLSAIKKFSKCKISIPTTEGGYFVPRPAIYEVLDSSLITEEERKKLVAKLETMGITLGEIDDEPNLILPE
jgi:hypothetical protein